MGPGVKSIRETNGVVTAVEDGEILEAKAVIDAAGVGCEPASAASLAGTRQLVERGIIRGDERVVAVLTGHLLKDPGILLDYHRRDPAPPGANRPIEIEADIREVERVVGSGGRMGDGDGRRETGDGDGRPDEGD